MDPVEIFRMAADTIKAHKLRSVLTTLGVLIGVGAVLANVAMINGFEVYFQEEVSQVGANFVQISAGSISESQVGGGEEEYFEEHVYDTLKRLPDLRAATSYRETMGTIEYRGKEEDILVKGVKPGYFEATETPVVEGSAIGTQDKNAVIITSEIKEGTFDRPMIVGTTFELTLSSNLYQTTREFRVKGVVDTKQSMIWGGGMLDTIYIPISTMNDMLNKEGYTTIGLYAETSEKVGSVKFQAVNTLNRLLRLEPARTSSKETTEGGGGGGLFSEETTEQRQEQLSSMIQEREEYSITTSQEILDFASNISSTIELLFVGIASISLAVGGIGIVNIMLVTVSERTREIGVMKAVGAKNYDVLMIFLLEAGLIGLIGGIVGLGAAYVLSTTIVPYLIGFAGIIPLPWVGIALGLSFSIGVLSGLYPAWRAANMDPVEALSYE